jgi:hypothetical protein
MGLRTFFTRVWQAISGSGQSGAASSGGSSKKPEFPTIIVVPTTPPSNSVLPGDFYKVVYEGLSYWVLFRCPCSCGEMISLTLQASQWPHWRVEETAAHRPTLDPSIWRNKGCKSHFWIRDGSVVWCGDSGTAPYISRPDLYVRRP